MQTLFNEYASNVILTQHYFYIYIKETHITSFRNLSNLSEHYHGGDTYFETSSI